jgi:hypothetical protein
MDLCSAAFPRPHGDRDSVKARHYRPIAGPVPDRAQIYADMARVFLQESGR